MPVTITACANSTPPAGTVVATQTVSGQDYQQFILVDNAGSALGQAAASPVYTALTNPTGSVLVTNMAASVLVTNIPASILVTNAAASIALTNPTGSVLVTNMAASVALTNPTGSLIVTNLTGSAAGSPTFVSVTNSPSVIVSSGSVVVTNAISASISNTAASILVTNMAASVLVTNLAGSAAGSPVYMSQTNMAGSAAGSPLFVTQNNMTGSAAGSPTFVSLTNLGGSAAGSPLYVSACLTNLAGSAAGSPLFVSVTNQVSASVSGGSVALLAGANVIGSASVIQGTPQATLANAWPVRLATSTGSNVGTSGSPLPVAFDNNAVWATGSLLTMQQAAISASASGDTIVVGGTGGQQIRVTAITFTTSASISIGWKSGSSTGTNLVGGNMFFGTNGGMDTQRVQGGYFFQCVSGCALVINLSGAASVRGSINYLNIPG